MKITFIIHYLTHPGQNIFLCGSIKELGKWNTANALKLNFIGNGKWQLTLSLLTKNQDITYNYFVNDESNNVIWESGHPRLLEQSELCYPVLIETDNWRATSDEEKTMYTSAFSNVIMKSIHTYAPVVSYARQTQEFKINVPRLSSHLRIAILGNQQELGNWDINKPLLLSCSQNSPLWKCSLDIKSLVFPVEYKYGIYDTKKEALITLEAGKNRYIPAPQTDEDHFKLISYDEAFNYPMGKWKGAGVAVPVFSLRSKNSCGVGEFYDLLPFISWATQVGIKMVQLLPINETIASHNWLDSYPYKSISVMALHPIYMNLEKMGKLNNAEQMEAFEERRVELNIETHVNYLEVLKLKSHYYKLLYDQEKDHFFENKDYISFFTKNKEWLIPYAAFAYLRDKMNNPDFRQWAEHSSYDEIAIQKISSPSAKEWDDIAIHYFIQYHLDKQLKEISEYARKNGIVLKGDIPIGISPNSVDAWTEPHLFNFNGQAGAPPDDFAIKGQNWGFPTYNWEAMAREEYKWWKKRLHKMADYFDAYRIDHILGFFRIWEIPKDALDGLLGHFSPALPMTRQEIENYGIHFDYNRFTQPYIKHHIIQSLFWDQTEEVIEKYLINNNDGTYSLKKEFNSQLKVNQYFLSTNQEENLKNPEREIRDGLMELITNVLFLQTGKNEFHPRITLHNTSSFAELDDFTKSQLSKIYYQFYYQRHDDFWHHQAMNKLPQIIEASNMLVCGEDLGMVPHCVAPLMKQLNILSLEIQRMSKDPKQHFGHPANAPYLSVCSTSTHDMSTIRGWWEEDKVIIQEFYNKILGQQGQAPYYAEPEICIQIINQHLYSPAMWAVFPIQDLIAMDGNLRWDKTQLEQINNPSNVRHKWRFRMNQSIEELLNAKDFNQLVRNLIDTSGRNTDF